MALGKSGLREVVQMSIFDDPKSGATTARALEVFDSLPAVDVDFMLGNWKGEGFPTRHPFDGLLEAYHWQGKRFDSAEEVHPLVFGTAFGGIAHVNPVFLGMPLGFVDKIPLPKGRAIGKVFQLLIPFIETFKSKARLRMTTYRGVTSATMIYDDLPIHDIFRKINDDTVFGLMDLKHMKNPFFFILRREVRPTE